MKKPLISAALATFNEEENIVDCLTSVKKFAGEVVIADGQSTDRTRELAENLDAKVIKTTNREMFHINKNLAIDSCHGQWIFLIDADERVTDELASEIRQIVKKNPLENGFWTNRSNWFLGDFLKKGGAYPDRVIRLFRRGKGHLPEISVHEQVKIEGKVGSLKNDLLHFADPSFERYLKRLVRYTDLTAADIAKKERGSGVWQTIFYLFVKPMGIFISLFLRHKGYQDGFRGFVWALFSAAHYFYAYVKYWEKQKD